MRNDWLDKLARRHRKFGILLDATALVLWIVGTLDRNLIGKHRRLTAYQTEDFDALRYIVARFSLLVTTPHVLMEAADLAKMIGQPIRTQLLEALAAIVQNAQRIDERFVAARELSQLSQFASFGLADAAVAEVARRNVLVLTDDTDLLAELDRLKLSALSIMRLQVG